MAHLDTNRHIYYYVLQGNSNILSDERDKKKLLDIILSVRRERDFELYAFCLTDEEVFLLTGAKRQAKLDRAVRVISAEYAAYYVDKHIYAKNAAYSGVKSAATLQDRRVYGLETVWKERLNHMQEVRDKCRAIHCIPVERGYAGRIRDYWWSSYRSYLGYYEWKDLDMLPMLQLFAPEPEKARRQLRRFHELIFQNGFETRSGKERLLLEVPKD
ncbi:MAG: hypothetical protein Q4C59_00845 [Lachnospiraceae bacterium]|nr:hypothetical protein [Lachnospiraceae bacterium]